MFDCLRKAREKARLKEEVGAIEIMCNNPLNGE
jgi:hypothetical protein